MQNQTDPQASMADIPLSPEAKVTIERRGQIVLIGINRLPNSEPDRPAAASIRNRLFSAMPSSICWPAP